MPKAAIPLIVLLLALVPLIAAEDPPLPAPTLRVEAVHGFGATRDDEPFSVRVVVGAPAGPARRWRLRLSFTGEDVSYERGRQIAVAGGGEETTIVSQRLPAGPCTVVGELIAPDGSPVAERRLADHVAAVDALAEAAGRDVAVFESALTPFTWCAARTPALTLCRGLAAVGLGAPTRLWAWDGERVRALAPGDRLGGAELAESWLLISFTGGAGWDALAGAPFALDVPLLVVLERRPSAVEMTDDGVRIVWPSTAGRLAVAPLAGVALTRADDTARWLDQLPRNVVARCRRLAAAARSLPLDLIEDYRVDPVRDVVAVRDRVDAWSFSDEWGAAPRPLAPLDPLIALAAREGCPCLAPDAELVDFDYAVGAGAFAGVEKSDAAGYELRGTLTPVNTVELPGRIPVDDPLLAAARGRLAQEVAALGDAPELERIAPLAGLAPYADADTRARIAKRADLALAAALATRVDDAPAAARVLIDCERVAALVGGARLAERIPAIAALARTALGAPRWGAGGLAPGDGVDGDARLGAAIAWARLAWRAGDDRSWRRACWWTAKQLGARWAAVSAYPRWLRSRDAWAGAVADERLAVHEVGGEVRMTVGASGVALAPDVLAWVEPAPANLGLRPDRPPFVAPEAAAALGFAVDHCGDWLALLVDDLPRRNAPDWYAAAYVDEAALPASDAPADLVEQLAPALGPRPLFAVRAALTHLPASERRRRAQRFWEANGGVAGHEWEIILAGVDGERATLWRDDAGVPPADERFARGFSGADAMASGSGMVAIAAPTGGWPTLGWLSPSAPVGGDRMLPLPLCPIAPDPQVCSVRGSWTTIDAQLRCWVADLGPAVVPDPVLDTLPERIRAALIAADPATAAERAREIRDVAAVGWQAAGPLPSAPIGDLPAVDDGAWRIIDGSLAIEVSGGWRLRRWVHCAAAGEALLAIGSDHSVEARIDGVCVHRHLVRRPLRADDDLARVRLAAGWNRLDLWLPDGGVVIARLCDPGLLPLPGCEVSPGPPAGPEGVQASPSGPAEPVPAP